MKQADALGKVIFTDIDHILEVGREIGRVGKFVVTKGSVRLEKLETFTGQMMGLLDGPRAARYAEKTYKKVLAKEYWKGGRFAVKTTSNFLSFANVLIAFRVFAVSLKVATAAALVGAWFDLASATVDLLRYQSTEKDPKNHMVRVAKRIDATIRVVLSVLALAFVSTSLPLAIAFGVLGTISSISVDFYKEMRDAVKIK